MLLIPDYLVVLINRKAILIMFGVVFWLVADGLGTSLSFWGVLLAIVLAIVLDEKIQDALNKKHHP